MKTRWLVPKIEGSFGELRFVFLCAFKGGGESSGAG